MKSEYGIKVIRPLYIGKALYFPPKSVSLMRSVRVRGPELFSTFSTLLHHVPGLYFCYVLYFSSSSENKQSICMDFTPLHLSSYPICSNFAATVPSRRFLSSYYLIMGFEFLSVYLSILFFFLAYSRRKIMLREDFNFPREDSKTPIRFVF